MSSNTETLQAKGAAFGISSVDTTARAALVWSSFVLAFLQSICSAVLALNGVRLLLGLTSLAFADTAIGLMKRFHADWIRMPMIAIALLGTILNIAVLLHFQRLRNRPASQWRRRQRSPHEIRMETLQWVISILTLVAIAVEESIHFYWHSTL